MRNQGIHRFGIKCGTGWHACDLLELTDHKATTIWLIPKIKITSPIISNITLDK